MHKSTSLSKLLALRLVFDFGVDAGRRVDSKYSNSVQLRGLPDHQNEEYANIHDNVDRPEIRKVNSKNSSTSE